MPPSAEDCPNCGAVVALEYCPACGQRRGDYRRSLGSLLGELVRELLELDGRLGRTLRALLRPGRLTREFNDGRRRRYTSPIRLYLFVCVALFATASVTFRVHNMLAPPEPGVGTTEIEIPDDDIAALGTALGGMLRERLTELREMPPAQRDKELFTGALEHGPLVMFFMLPIYATLLKLVFLGTRRLYVDHLVFSLHLHTVWFLLLIPAIALPFAWAGLFLLPIPLYTVAALQHAYSASWWATLLRSCVLVLLYSVALAFGLASAFALGVILG